MAVNLSPWPALTATQTEAGNELSLAVSALKDAISPGAANDTIERLGAVASAHVEKYAPDAPDPVKSEAVIRFASYLFEAESGAVRSDGINVGEIRTETDFITNHAAVFRNCAAAALLSPWKVRRAGALKKSDE